MAERWAYDSFKLDEPPEYSRLEDPYKSLEEHEVRLPGGITIAVVMASCPGSAVVLAEKATGIGRRWLRADLNPGLGHGEGRGR